MKHLQMLQRLLKLCGAMLGFSDIHDDDMLTIHEIAERMDYSRASSLRRWLSAQGLSLPPCLRRGRYRGAQVKAWYAGLSEHPDGQAGELENERGRPGQPEGRDEETNGARVYSLKAQRDAMLARITGQ